MGNLGFRELLIILVIALVIFGAKKLKTVGSDLGAAVKGFKKGMADGDDEQGKQLSDLAPGTRRDADFNDHASSSTKSDSRPG
ncbi:MAG: Sec-independent protein translocase subunit TatA [Steroidobacteraceae bacterium]